MKIVSKIARLVFVLAVCSLVCLSIVSPVLANNEGGSAGEGGSSTCPDGGCWYAQRVGATWRYYTLDPNDPSSDDIYIPGYNDLHGQWRNYARPGHITQCREAGGYYRYAVVTNPDARNVGGYAHQQLGLLGIGGGTAGWTSSELGGGTHYRGPNEDPGWGNLKWDDVRSKYEEARRAWPDIYKRGWGEDSDLSWFCYGPGMFKKATVKFSGYYRHEGCYGEVVEEWTRDIANEKSVQDKDDGSEDNVVHLRGVKQQIDSLRSQGWNLVAVRGDSGSIIGSQEADPLSVRVNNGTRNIEYYFEKVDTDDCGPCSDWTPDQYKQSNSKEGWTKVRIGVVNKSLPDESEYSKWHHEGSEASNGLMTGPIYAKPTDDVQWMYCYYPGVERAANTLVTLNNDHGRDANENNRESYSFSNRAFSNTSGWTGSFTAKSTGLKSEEDVSYTGGPKTPSGKDDPRVGTLPGGLLSESDEAMGGAQAEDDESKMYKVQPREQPSLSFSLPNGLAEWGDRKDYFELRLDPGGWLRGDIKTSGTTHVKVEESKHHSWSCHWDTHCSEEGGCYSHYHDTCSHSDDYVENHIYSEEQSDFARVYVPYNFKNSAFAKISSEENEPVYAGETVSVIEPTITIGKRVNETLRSQGYEDGYATQVPNAKGRLMAFIVSQADFENNNFWSQPTTTDDGYGNTVDGGDVLWNSYEEACKGVNAKFGVCKYLETTGKEGHAFNEIGNMEGLSYNLADQSEMQGHHAPGNGSNTYTYNVFDEAAGNYFCISAAVWPFATTNDLEQNGDGDSMWYFSKPDCRPIAKRPTFQVWGGGIFSAGDITTNEVTRKNNVLDSQGTTDSFAHDWFHMTSAWALNDNVNWQGEGQNSVSLFGSWGELGIMAGGKINTMASGGTTGYAPHVGEEDQREYDAANVSTWNKASETPRPAGATNVVGMGNPGGLRGDLNFCLRSPLSLANNIDCNNIGSADVSTLRSTLESEKQEILGRFPAGANNGTYSRYDGVYQIGGWPANAPSTVIMTGTNITINGNIEYPTPTNGFKNLQNIPKMFIYSEGDITVDCSVTRIDAIMIADGTFKSCNEDTQGFGEGTYDPANPGGWNNTNLSHQLVINGTVVADKVELNRSYGAGTGRYSMVPAELINYDSSIYLWANREAEGITSGSLTEITSRELAPRY